MSEIGGKYIQTELGKEKKCIHCGEYFPCTKEFFYGTGRTYKNGEEALEGNCKDCYKQKFKPWTKRTYNVAHRHKDK